MTPPPSLQDLIDTVRQDSPSEDPLDQLATASAAVGQLEATSDALLGHFVDRCRRGGQSWSQISAALGVSKQAVHKRFSGSIADRLIESHHPPTFERFTSRARAVLVAADAGARAQGRTEVGAEDLLTGLFAEPEGLAAKALTAMDISRDRVEEATGATGATVPAASAAGTDASTEASTGSSAGASTTPAGDRLAWSAPARDTLRNALVEALELGHNYIGTEHILLGLLRDPDAPAAQVLARLGATPAETKVRLTELLRGFTKPPAAGQ
jgi:ATP-dependent Clp protease ATP-binding subunit ClpA